MALLPIFTVLVLVCSVPVGEEMGGGGQREIDRALRRKRRRRKTQG